MNAIQIADSFDMLAVDHAPDGWPAVQQKQLTEAALMLRKQHEAIVELRLSLTYASTYVIEREIERYGPCMTLKVIQKALADTEELVK